MVKQESSSEEVVSYMYYIPNMMNIYMHIMREMENLSQKASTDLGKHNP